MRSAKYGFYQAVLTLALVWICFPVGASDFKPCREHVLSIVLLVVLPIVAGAVAAGGHRLVSRAQLGRWTRWLDSALVSWILVFFAVIVAAYIVAATAPLLADYQRCSFGDAINFGFALIIVFPLAAVFVHGAVAFGAYPVPRERTRRAPILTFIVRMVMRHRAKPRRSGQLERNGA